MRTVRATRYVTPLREGGSLPAIVEADDDGLYVVKFRGAGQGPKALIAELIGGEAGRALGLPIPELVFVDLDTALGRNEPDTEIQELITRSGGLNIASDFLPGSLGFDPVTTKTFDPVLAARAVWFDAFITNVDRTARNPNILVWHREPWLIDHGASLIFHHTWEGYREKAPSPFAAIASHVLLRFAGPIAAVDAGMRGLLPPDVLAEIVALVPESWLVDAPFASPGEHREAYVTYLQTRLDASSAFVEEADRARPRL